jgi:chemotaxis signal transduction protein
MACILLSDMRAGEEHAVDEAAQGSFCIFEYGGVRLALAVGEVSHVIDRPPVTPVPAASEPIAGLIGDRGEALLAMRLDQWLRTASTTARANAAIVLTGTPRLALTAERVCGIAGLGEALAGPAESAADAAIVAAYRRGPDGPVAVLAAASLRALASAGLAGAADGAR